MDAIEGKRILIKGPVTFRGGAYYIGRNMACRVLLSPALGSQIEGDKRFVIHQPNLWFGTAFQNGYISILNYAPAPIEKIPIDTIAFEWRRQRTSRLWAKSPVDHDEKYSIPKDPYALHSHYSDEISDFVVVEKGYTYFIMAAGMDRVRIGWTTSPNRRPGELVRSSPVLLEYAALLPGTQDDESWLQRRFRHLNTHDDWFELTPELRDYIAWVNEYWRKPGENPILGRHKLPVGARGIEW